jgi:hypothetical protein
MRPRWPRCGEHTRRCGTVSAARRALADQGHRHALRIRGRWPGACRSCGRPGQWRRGADHRARTCSILRLNTFLNWGNAATGMVLAGPLNHRPSPALIGYHQRRYPLVRACSQQPGVGSWECPGQWWIGMLGPSKFGLATCSPGFTYPLVVVPAGRGCSSQLVVVPAADGISAGPPGSPG